MIEESQLRGFLQQGMTIWAIMEKVACSKNTVRNRLKQYGIPTPQGFFARPEYKVGRPPGFKHKEEWLQNMSRRFSGVNNPFAGRKHDAAAIAKMSRPRPSVAGDRSPFRRSLLRSESARQAHRERVRRRWAAYTPEQRREIARKFSEAQARNAFHRTHATYQHHKHGFHESPKAGIVFYRSSWEKRVFVMLDESRTVVSYQVEPFVVPYTDSKGCSRWTKPDALIRFSNGQKLLVEVKPLSMLPLFGNPEKIMGLVAYAKVNDLQFAVIDEKVLFVDGTLAALLDGAEQGTLYADASN